MKHPEFLKNIHIGEIIRAEMKRKHLTLQILAEKLHLEKWIIRELLQQKSIKINRLIDISYAMKINFLQIYLQEMLEFENLKLFEDEVTIKIIDSQASIVLSKRSKTAAFTQSIHIGSILKMETKKQQVSKKILSEILCCSQSAIDRMFLKPDIDTKRLILMSFILKYNFIHNIYMPYMAVNENEMNANDCISEFCTIIIKPKTVSIFNRIQTGIYHGIWSQK